MWPWGHLAVGYLAYSLYTRTRTTQPPEDAPTLALAVGTQFPDLIDKPLAWTVGLLPNGRSLAHSVLTALLVIAALKVLAHRRARSVLANAFAIGYLSHLGADALHPLVERDLLSVAFLAWPIVPAIEYDTDKSFLAHLHSIEFTPFFTFELGLVVLTLLVWIRDGAPGLVAIRRIGSSIHSTFAR